MEKISKGDTFQCQTIYTQKDVEIFSIISGDRNPIHLDDKYAANSIFGKRIVHGFLSGSIFSKVFGTIWPGEGTIYMSQDMCFRSPCFTDTEYIAKFIVEDVHKDKHRGIVNCILETLDGKVVIIGKAVIMHKDRF